MHSQKGMFPPSSYPVNFIWTRFPNYNYLCDLDAYVIEYQMRYHANKRKIRTGVIQHDGCSLKHDYRWPL